MSTSNNQLATRLPATQVATNSMPRRRTLERPIERLNDRPTGPTVGRLPVPAQPLRLVVDHDGVIADDRTSAVPTVKQVSSPSSSRSSARGAIPSSTTKSASSKSLKAAASREASPAKARLSARVSSRVSSAIGTVIGAALGRSKKSKAPQSPLVCLGPGGEFATAYVGERDGSLTATDPEQFTGIAGTDRAHQALSPQSATESERALLAVAAIGAATAARLKAQMATVYRLASLCRAAMNCVTSLSPLRNGGGAGSTVKKAKSAKARKATQALIARRNAAAATDGLFTAAAPNQPGTVEAPAGPKSSAATAGRSAVSRGKPSAPAAAPTAPGTSSRASRPAARPASSSSQRSKSPKAGAARSKGVQQSSFSTAATQPLLPLAQEVAA